MTGMPITPAHAKPVARRDHLWVLAIVAAFALYDVWGSWTEIGNKSGFAHGTGWTLTVIVEVYWGYALYAWLAAAPGPRSRRFAMWSAAVVFALSLAGQGASHLTAHRTPPPAVVVFVSVLPVIVLALLAILVHLRHLDRAEAAETGRQDTLTAELEAERAARETAEAERDSAAASAAEAVAKAEALTRKLANPGPRKRGGTTGRKQARKPAGTAPRNQPPVNPEPEAVPGGPMDLDAEARILALIDEGHSPSRAGVMAGKSDSYGRQVARAARDLSRAAPQGQDDDASPRKSGRDEGESV